MFLDVSFNTWVLLLVAAMNGLTLYYTRRTEKNTNSMKDALVSSTAKTAHAAGMSEQRGLSEAKAAAVADGVKQGEASGH